MYSVVLMVALTGSAETTEWRCCGCTGYTACCGRVHHTRCHGCTGYVCSGYVCSGCFGGCSGHHRHHRCCGCTGYVAPVCCGYTPCGGVAPVPAGPAPSMTPMPGTKTSAPAMIVVNIPANANLMVDGNATTSTSARRVFVTPSLETSSEYVYNLTASVDGQIQTRTVTVQGGRTTEVNFSFATTSVASR